MTSAISKPFGSGIDLSTNQKSSGYRFSTGVEGSFALACLRISRELDGGVEKILKQPIEHSTPYLFVDASYFKVGVDSRYITQMLMG